MKKIGIIFGGKSSEHEISILSASSVIDAIDRSKFEVVQIGINKNGDWFHISSDMSSILNLLDERIISLIPEGKEGTENARAIKVGELDELVDFAFPILHGPFGEDGTIQGLFEMIGIPYAGCGVSSSAVSMDKIFTKELMVKAGLPSCKYIPAYAYLIKENREGEFSKFEDELGYPMIIKPANMGSSVGVAKAENREELEKAIDEALKYDDRLLIEEFLSAREIEIAVLGNDYPITGAVGEIVAGADFYDYESKYKSSETQMIIPADIPKEFEDEISSLAIKLYHTLGASGFARTDFFIENETNKILINEINTIPGFTKFSMFPLLCKEKNIAYSELIERIIDLGHERHNAKNNR